MSKRKAITTVKSKLPANYSIKYINKDDNEDTVTERSNVILCCDKGHEVTSKVRLLRDKNCNFCTECNKIDRENARIEELKKKFNEHNINVLSVNKRLITYICNHCYNNATCEDSVLRANVDKRCKNCSSQVFKNSYDKVKNIIDKEITNFELNMTEKEFNEQYKNKESKLCVKCKNCLNDKYYVRMAELKTNLGCDKCCSTIRSNTMMNKYGVSNAMNVPEFREKQKQSVFKNFGVYYPQQSEQVRNKTTKTSLKKYGAIRAFAREEVYKKIRSIHKENHGCEYPFQNKDIQKKCEESCIKTTGERKPLIAREYFENVMLKKYGAKHALQNPIIFKKVLSKLYSTKKYTFPNGRIVNIQGYEHFAIDKLLKDGIDENDIFVEDEVQTIKYKLTDVKTNKKEKHIYYPDIYLKSKNKIIEVKSIWTYNKDAYKNYKKGVYVARNDYVFEIWIFKPDGKCIFKINFKKNDMNRIEISHRKLPNFELKKPYMFCNKEEELSEEKEKEELDNIVLDEIKNISNEELLNMITKENFEYDDEENKNIDNLEINDIIPSYYIFMKNKQLQSIIRDIKENYPSCPLCLNLPKSESIEQLNNIKEILINKYNIIPSTKMFDSQILNSYNKEKLVHIIYDLKQKYDIKIPFDSENIDLNQIKTSLLML